jgi:Mg2+-importing ATPase
LIVTTAAIMLVGAVLPFSPLGPAFGFAPLPLLYWPLFAATLLGYVLLTQVVKTRLIRMGWVSE